MSSIRLAIQQLANEQKRITTIVENYAFNESLSSTTSIATNNDPGSTLNTQSYQSAVSFLPVDNPAPASRPLRPEEIETLPTIDSSTLPNNIVTDKSQVSEDDFDTHECSTYHQYTASLKIIGVSTNDAVQFANTLLSRNRWLKLKYLYINRIYQTKSSYSRSYL